MARTIQWYPGHMAKAQREAKEKMQLVDIVLELVDARIPISSQNPVLEEIIGNKPSILVLNKADMAENQQTQAWIAEFEQQGRKAVAIDAQHQRGLKELQKMIKVVMEPFFEERRAKGIKDRPIRLMILGIPNVGKSTLINRFVGKNQAITGNKPGVTKQQRWLKFAREFELLDTPGILWPKFDDPEVGIKLAITGAIKDDLLYHDDLALYLLDQYKLFAPQILAETYRLDPSTIEAGPTVDLLMHLTQRLGFKDDYDQASLRLIQDYRQLKLGNLSLDRVTYGNH